MFSTTLNFHKLFFSSAAAHDALRGGVKYYFADFVRKGGTPPPFTDFFFGKKGVTDLGGTPLCIGSPVTIQVEANP